MISPEEISIPWQPLFQLYRRTNYSKYKDLELIVIPRDYETDIRELIKKCRIYFPIESTQEMLDKWRPLLCPYDTKMSEAIDYFELFLPTLTKPENHKQGFKLWFEEFMIIWNSYQSEKIVSLLTRLTTDTIGFIDWNPYIPKIFTLLKNELKGRVNIFNEIVGWLVSMLSPNSICQKYLIQFLKSIKTFYYPSNSPDRKLEVLLSSLSLDFTNRLHRERYELKSWLPSIPVNHKLSEQDITDFSTL